MIKNPQRRMGSAHVVIIIILVLAVIGALGFIFWQNFTNKDGAEVNNGNTVNQTESIEDSTDEENVLVAGSFDGRTGIFQVRGYLYTEDVPEPHCESNCATYERAFFYISESPNKAVDTFISENGGSAFVANSAVALGCVVDGRIQATVPSVGAPSSDKIYSSDVSTRLINSSKAEPVSVEIGRSVEPIGIGAPVCYSHFDSISAI